VRVPSHDEAHTHTKNGYQRQSIEELKQTTVPPSNVASVSSISK
jgi:hypothetical protein